MMHFTVDDYQALDSCQKCCCERLNLRPGTINKISVGYAAWAVPIGQLHCVPQFQFEQKETCPVGSGNQPPQVTDTTAFETPINTALAGDLKTRISDPEAQPMTFKALSLYGPQHGKLELAEDGTFDYTPAPNFKGQERFYASANDGSNTATFEVMVAVGIAAAGMTPTPHVSVGPATVDQRYFTVSFPIIVSPAAQPCEIWRLTVLQAALDCDCTCFTRTDCFDIGIASC